MAERTIDLRKKESAAPVASPPPRVSASRAASLSANALLMEWTAPEYEVRARGPYWLAAPLAVVTLLIIFGILTRNYFFIALIILSFGVLLMYQKRAPREISCSITEQGVHLGSRLSPFSEFKSFWIFDTPGMRELSLETKKALRPYLRIPLGTTQKAELQETLQKFLPEAEHQESMIDRIARAL